MTRHGQDAAGRRDRRSPHGAGAILLFCIASDTEWEWAGVSGATVAAMMIRGLMERDPGGKLTLTKQGRDVLAALLGEPQLIGHLMALPVFVADLGVSRHRGDLEPRQRP